MSIKKALLALAVVFLFAVPLAQADTGNPIMAAVCLESHLSPDDPIVFPSNPGVSHLHEFSGSWTTNAFSTYQSMRNSRTTCNQPGDTAGYWTPAMYNSDGLIRKSRTYAYYIPGDKSQKGLKAFPADLRMIADIKPGVGGSGWRCDGDPPSKPVPGNCPGDHSIQARVVFPDCWDGKHLDSADHRSHMAYAGEKGKCPTDHPVPVPRLQLKSVYRISKAKGLYLAPSAGSMMPMPLTTYHADFWNTWDQPTLEKLVKQCIIEGRGGRAPCEFTEPKEKDPKFRNPSNPKPFQGR
jgi:hypothetical protein